MASQRASRSRNIRNNVSEDIVIDENVTENVPDNPENEDKTMTADTLPTPDNSADTSTDNVQVENPDTAAANEAKVVEVAKFDLPANPADLELSDPFAKAFGQKILETFAEIKSREDTLRSAAEGDSSAAIVQYSESDGASANVQNIYGAWAAAKVELENIWNQLAAVVKTEKGDVQLSADDIEKIKSERKNYVNVAKHGLVAFEEFVGNNEPAEDVKLFSDTIKRIIGGQKASAGKSSGSSGTYEQTTNIRPRLSNKGEDGGYVEFNGQKFSSFTPAIKVIEKIDGGKDVTVGMLHKHWVAAATGQDVNADNLDLNKWTSIPKGDTQTFNVGTDEKPIVITVHTEYVAPTA